MEEKFQNTSEGNPTSQQNTNTMAPKTPQVTTQQPPIETPANKQQSQTPPPADTPRKNLLISFLAVFIIVFLSFGGWGLYAVAYERITLDNYPEEQKMITNFVISIPFMPKTPTYVIHKTIEAQETVTSFSYDLSLALERLESVALSALNFTDFQANGAVDFSEFDNPIFTTEITSNNLKLQLRKPGGKIYFLLEEVPSQLISLFLGGRMDTSDILNQWVYYDLSPLETEARQYLREQNDSNPILEMYQEFYDEYVDDTVRKKIKLEDAELDGLSVYKLYIDVDQETLRHIDQIQYKKKKTEHEKKYGIDYPSFRTYPKLSDSIENMYIELLMDKENFYIRKLTVNAEMGSGGRGSILYSLVGSLGTSTGDRNFTLISNFSDFNESVEPEEPSDAISVEDFLGVVEKTYTAPEGSVGRSRDSQRISDSAQISRALGLYYIDNSSYPTTLQQLVPDYLKELPTDPVTLEQYYYTASEDDFDICANMETSGYANNQCPDPAYNFHIDSSTYPVPSNAIESQ